MGCSSHPGSDSGHRARVSAEKIAKNCSEKVRFLARAWPSMASAAGLIAGLSREVGTASPVCIVDCVLETRISTPTLKPPRESVILRRRAESTELDSSLAAENVLTNVLTTVASGAALSEGEARADEVVAFHAREISNAPDSASTLAREKAVHGTDNASDSQAASY